MKRLALIAIAVLGLTVTVSIAQARPAGMSQAEYRALMLRSQGLNQQYGVVQVKGENYYARGFAAAPDDSVPVKGENYFANGLPKSTPNGASSSTQDFEWGNVGIGAAALLCLLLVVAGAIGLRRHRVHLRTS